MIIKYGYGWMKFPERVWEPAESNPDGWVSRPATAQDTQRRKELATDDEVTEIDDGL